MSNVLTVLAKTAAIASMVLLPAMATPSFAGQSYNHTPAGWDYCNHHGKCFRTNETPGTDASSEGNFPFVCNGVLGWWEAIPMPGNATFCVAKSTADFFHNGSPGSESCTSGWKWGNKVKHQSTASGSCPEQHHYSHPI